VPPTTGSAQADGDTILVVDDEPALRETIAYNLRREGFQVIAASDGPGAIAAARTGKPDLILLDVMLPGLDGLQVCRALRAESNVPIIIVSAKVEEVDRVLGLEMGADDYLTKPFAMRELVARVRANLRRIRMHEGDSTAETSPERGTERITVGKVTVDPARRQATLGGAMLTLKPKEFDLLHYLARRPGLVLSRDALLREVWGYDFPVDTRTVDVHIRWLRQKLSEGQSGGVTIETVRGFGYRLAVESTS
jgi:DNA-binding response OmpR family regulator